MHCVGRGPLGIVVRARSVPFDPQVRALFWALSTMSSLGYGDGPSAHTNFEYLWAITCQVLGACMYAAIFSNVAQLIAKLDAAGSRYSGELDKITEFRLGLEFTSKRKLLYARSLFASARGSR